MNEWRSWPAAARVLVAGVSLAGVAVTAVRLPEIQVWTGRDAVLFAGLAVAVAVGEFFQFELPYRTERTVYVVTDAEVFLTQSGRWPNQYPARIGARS